MRSGAKGLEEARRCFEMADALNCTYVAAPPFGIRDRDVDLFSVARRYGELVDEVAGFRAKPLLEFWGIAQTLGTLGEALLVAAECGRPRYGASGGCVSYVQGEWTFSRAGTSGSGQVGAGACE